MSNVKGLPGYVECDDYRPIPPRGTMHGYVRLLAKSPRYNTVSFFLNDRKFLFDKSDLPEWVNDGAHIEIDFGQDTIIRLITPAQTKT